ncbi:cold regulated 314 thylakoid membrane 2 [Actinidia rufa]|uniref:Cold regulated 314 thylakoid membrane 2 n=1 Tax=Actinidia rufa TaxID=165716 RepID=A0A7J0DWB9_9ERIC|nr:cold regulated 314 thylakoid membrane 2 [Actinidia rufa]
MQTLSLSSTRPFSLHKTHLPSLNEARVLHFTHHSSFFHFKPLRASSNCKEMKLKKRLRGFGPVCYSAPFTPNNLQWISTVSTAGEYGIWAAFLALLVRLFFFIPGELELPFVALLLVIVAPYQVMNLRGTQEGAILSLVIAGYLAFQHCSWAGSLRKAFDRGPLVATLALICTFTVSCLLLI